MIGRVPGQGWIFAPPRDYQKRSGLSVAGKTHSAAINSTTDRLYRRFADPADGAPQSRNVGFGQLADGFIVKWRVIARAQIAWPVCPAHKPLAPLE